MIANAGGTIEGEAIIGRDKEIKKIWDLLSRKSILLTSERRIGKTSILRKIKENPEPGWLPVLCFVESVNQPAECVQRIYAEVDKLGVRQDLQRAKTSFVKCWNGFAGGVFGDWKLPKIEAGWKYLLNQLIKDIAQNMQEGTRLLIMLDEFPHMINNMEKTAGGNIAIEFLDALRELRQNFEGTGKIRFILSGSVGLHLIVDHLREKYEYAGRPVNNMEPFEISGMSADEVSIMCRMYLDDENISRGDTCVFDRAMFESTDGLPLYVQYVCERFQTNDRKEVSVESINAELSELINSSSVEWFRDMDERIRDYYSRLGKERISYVIMDELSSHEDYVSEVDIIEYAKSQIEITREEEGGVKEALDLLLRDHYIDRDIRGGARHYKFKYKLVREWWKLNRGTQNG